MKTPKKVPYISGNGKPKKASYISENWAFKSKLQKIKKKFYRKNKFFIPQEM